MQEMTAEQRSAFARKGVEAYWQTTTFEQRKERARKVVQARTLSTTQEQRLEWARSGGKAGGPKGGKIGGPKVMNSPDGKLIRILGTRASISKRPTWPEARFYGLVLGDSITADGFSAQQWDGHGIYDGAWREKKIVAELDGGGHHAFRDRHAEDTHKDIARKLEYNTVLRETDENVLFLKALAILMEEQ